MLVKTPLIAAAGLTLACVLSTAAVAQDTPAPPQPPAPQPQQQQLPMQPFTPSLTMQEQIWRQSLTDTALTAPTKAEWARARRAAQLINADRCDEAFTLARTEKDDRLETGVRQVCLARGT